MRTFHHVTQSMLTTSCMQWERGLLVTWYQLDLWRGRELTWVASVVCRVYITDFCIKTLDTEAWWASVVAVFQARCHTSLLGGVGHVHTGSPFQCSCLKNPWDRAARRLQFTGSNSQRRLRDGAHGIAFSSAGRSPLPCLSCALLYAPLPAGDFNLCLLVGINHNCE